MHLISYVTFLWILLIMFKLILGQEKKTYHVHTERAVALDGIYLNKYIYPTGPCEDNTKEMDEYFF